MCSFDLHLTIKLLSGAWISYTAAPNERDTEKDKDDYKHNIECEVSKLEFRLDIDYKTWMKSKYQYSKQFRYELANVLNVRSNYIELDNYREGSVILEAVIRIFNPKRWLRFQNNTLSDQDAHDHFIDLMRIQDQISVSFQNKWYNATI